MTIKKGQQVFIKPEFQDSGDNKFTWFAVADEDGGRVMVECRGCLENFKPRSVMQTVWLLES